MVLRELVPAPNLPSPPSVCRETVLGPDPGPVRSAAEGQASHGESSLSFCLLLVQTQDSARVNMCCLSGGVRLLYRNLNI